MSEPILQLRGVNKSFGAVQVLHDVDFDVRAGEVTALVGDNGAGKSTLVKCIAGIHPYDSGAVRFNGKDTHIRGPRDAADLGIEVVYQDLALADNLDIVQNMFLGRLVAEVHTKDVTHGQVVELITAGRSGDLGLARPEAVVL